MKKITKGLIGFWTGIGKFLIGFCTGILISFAILILILPIVLVIEQHNLLWFTLYGIYLAIGLGIYNVNKPE